MLPEKLKPGDCIGLVSPSWLATEEKFAPIKRALEDMGFRVKYARNLFASGWGYAATPQERAEGFNELVRDEDVKMIFFGGGEGADDIVPLIDYDAVKANPKLYLSYSDGTSILCSIWSRTGLSTLYGQMPGLMPEISPYNREQFFRHVTATADAHESAQPWHVLRPGCAQGTLVGGYLFNFTYLVGTGKIPMEPGRRYVLFIEDHEQFNNIECESAAIARLEHSGVMPYVAGFLFGHYAKARNPYLLQRLKALADAWQIPAAYCDDFGHGEYHAILPIGAQATLDTVQCTLTYRQGE